MKGYSPLGKGFFFSVVGDCLVKVLLKGDCFLKVLQEYQCKGGNRLLVVPLVDGKSSSNGKCSYFHPYPLLNVGENTCQGFHPKGEVPL